MNRRTVAYLRWQLAKLEDNYIDLPVLLGVKKDVLSRYWRTDRGDISITRVEELLNENNAPKLKIEVIS